MVSTDNGWDIYSKGNGWKGHEPTFGSISKQYLYIGIDAIKAGFDTKQTYAIASNGKEFALLPEPRGYKVSANGALTVPKAVAKKFKLNGRQQFTAIKRDNDAWVFGTDVSVPF